MMNPTLALISLERRFAAKVQITPTCHLWISTLNNKGRPAIGVPAALIGKARMMQDPTLLGFFITAHGQRSSTTPPAIRTCASVGITSTREIR
jgi:hypothetical protein